MTDESMEMYMNTLSGYIHDEDKLVTYKWLSKDLQVHVNKAKNILEEYWERHKNSGIVATLLLIGRLKKGGIQVEVIREINLKTALEKYQDTPSMHIYSLQKTLPDIQLLANSGKGDLKFSSIKCEPSHVLTEEEIFARRWGSTIKFQAAVVDKPQSKNEKPVEKTPAKESDEPKITPKADKPVETVKPKKISPPKNGKGQDKKGKQSIPTQKAGFNNLFGKVVAANQKKSPPTKEQNKATPMEIDSPEVTEKPKQSTEKPSIFQKASSKSQTKEKSTEKPSIFQKASSKSPEVDSSSEKVDSASKKSAEPKITEKTTSESQSSNAGKITNGKTITKPSKTVKPQGKKRTGSQNVKNESKKRKRIMVAEDSSEDSAASDSESKFVDTSPPPEEEKIVKEKSPSPPPVQHVNGRRKIRKVVDQTYMDEDGYLVTKKVQVYESCSEEDEPAIATTKKPAEPVKESGKPPKKPNKQTTLMSFFKKA